MSNIHTMTVPSVPALVHILSEVLPAFIQNSLADSQAKPVRLLVIDAIAELFHEFDNRSSSQSLVQRSTQITQISSLLHSIANRYHLIVIVLNEVVDSFHSEHASSFQDTNNLNQISYKEQTRFFSQADTVPGEISKEVALGLVWANQVNARILLSRTGRRRYLNTLSIKKPRSSLGTSSQSMTNSLEELVLIRRMSLIFSSTSAPVSADYIVTTSGITGLEGSLEHIDHNTPRSGSCKDVLCLPMNSVVAPPEISLLRNENQSKSLGADEWDQFEDIQKEAY
jgi:DNA repair protein RAD57